MIIYLSSDPFVIAFAQTLSSSYNESVTTLDQHCHKHLGQDKSLLIMGHANREFFGDDYYTPDMLAADLLSFDLLDRVDTIYLVSCRIGEWHDRTSYFSQFAEKLFKLGPQYHAIKIYAFTNQISEEMIFDMTLDYFPYANGITITGVRAETASVYQEELELATRTLPLSRLETMWAALYNEKIQKLAYIRDLKLEGKTTSSDIEKLTLSLPTQAKISGHENLYINAKKKC